MGVLTRLAHDKRGNVLAISAAALIPLLAMIGSGVDMSRAYMTKARLQNACDSAALAGRRVMKNDTLTDAVRQEAIRFFNFNFPQGYNETHLFTPVVTRPERGVVKVAAQTEIPTTIMALFGFGTLPLVVECDASHNFVNTDVMLVLDVTGSMMNDINDNPTTINANRRITALRDAVMAMYDELAPVQQQLADNGLRLRYGIVPWSSTVNVGRLLRDASPNYIANTSTYQSRTPNFTTTPASGTGAVTQSNCLSREGGRWNDPSAGRCTYISSYTYHQRSLDTSAFKNLGTTVNVTPIIGGASTAAQNTTWNGCIEERATVNTITPTSGYAIPSGATDLNINLIPNSDATRWKPHWPEVVFRRTAGSTSATSGTAVTAGSDPAFWACPSEARRLEVMTRTQMQNYMNGLAPVGGTYLDIGMIWGARLISDQGVFAHSPNTYAGMPVAKHIIYMTDGAQTAYCNVYSAYGIERNDMRVSGSTSCSSDSQTNSVTANLVARHAQRFRMICNATKGMNVNIWVIAFGTDLTPDLVQCASNPGQAFTSANRDQLIQRFTEIGKNIGALRLSK